MSQYTVLLTVLLLSCCRVLLAGKSCYNPDQTVPSNPYYPCNTASGVDSACCGFGDQCTENGYCFGSAGYIYRGGCTDITWQSANCAHHCKDAAIHSASNLYPCPWNNGSYTANWCCDAHETATEGEPGCCDGPLFNFNNGMVGRVILMTALSSPLAPPSTSSQGAETADPSASTLASSSCFPAPSASSVALPISPSLSEPTLLPTPASLNPSSNAAQPIHRSLAIGAGIGVPVAGLLLFCLVFLLLRERRQRIRAQRMADDANTAAKMKEAERRSTPAKECTFCHNHLPQELDGVPHGPKEIDSQAVYEAKGSF